jgi:hypothetical protein
VVETATSRVASEREEPTLPPARGSRAAVDTRGPWIGVAIAAVGLAAGFGLYLASRRTQIVEVPVAENASPATASATPAPMPAPAPPKLAADAPAVTPDMLPAEKAAAPEPAPVVAEALAEPSSPAKPNAHVTPTRSGVTPTSGGARPQKVVLDEEHATTGATTASPTKAPLGGALRPAELTSNGGGVSDRPSTGAAQAAVGAVLGAARGCLVGQPAASSATLVFGSSGEVTSVGVNGPAAGTPAAACIKSALGKARVQPFAAPSFSLGVTVRPL